MDRALYIIFSLRGRFIFSPLCTFEAFVDSKAYIYLFFYLFLQHPQIQKKSQYIKYLCCDDVRTLHQWVNGIRIAKVGLNLGSCFFFSRQQREMIFLIPRLCLLYLKYGKQLYVNYQEAMKRTEAAYDWSSLSTSSIRSGSSSASIPGQFTAYSVLGTHVTGLVENL